ncbi:hemin-degrading factor [Thalassospira tepidiphila]|uniref:hemin-degrading factor n=1 Tax=Thalassospira tepidiphila TaxID=393657 RepID=UPI001BCC50C6|nr:ChuX/HutX family heme-like substrate-binding protein [Thalassospira tepidiphila]MBS8275083.1 hemin-degrading factor [Thalassospira tepidiphila]
MTDNNSNNFTTATEVWTAFAAGEAKGYAVDIAAELGLSEGELVAAGIGTNVVRLDADWGDFIPRLEELGQVKILTRNPSVVHEKIGTFGKISINGEMGLVLNHDVDLRLFLGRWGHAFAVETDNPRAGRRRSFQIFDHDGRAVHKIFLTEQSDEAAYDKLISDFKADNQLPGIEVLPPLPKAVTLPDHEVDVENLRAHWRRMTDVHQYHGMLKDFNVGRQQGMRLAGPEFAERLSSDALKVLLEKVSESGISIMVFVGNSGAIQIHTGPIKTIREMGEWINIMDPTFTLHLRMDQIFEAWIVRKPIREGMVTTIELYDRDLNNFAIFCGERKRKDPENPDWQKLAESLPRLENTMAAVAE